MKTVQPLRRMLCKTVIGISMLLIAIMITYNSRKLHIYFGKDLMKFTQMTGVSESKGKDHIQSKMSYVAAKPGPSVRLITHVTQGQQLRWNVTKEEEIIYTTVPQKDQHITQYKKKDIMNLKLLLEDIKSHVPGHFHGRRISDLINISAILHPDVNKKLQHWMNITKDSPEVGRSMNDILYQLNVLLNKKDPENPWKPKCEGCFKNEHRTILEPRQVCSGHDKIDIMAIITSVPKSKTSRNAIRETWGSWTKNNTSNFRLIFLFGDGWPESDNKILQHENTIYGDILQEDYHDSYYNLSQKVISGFKWVIKACPRAEYIMRSAEDAFVNVPEVLHLLQMYGSHTRFQEYQVGTCYITFRPHRWPDYKGYLSTDDYADHIFPPYALGTTYLTSMKLTKKILKKTKDVPYIPIEDSYFGLVLREIDSGCTTVMPFSPAGNSVSDGWKYKLFSLANKTDSSSSN